MGHKFQQAASEIRALTDALESSVMKALEQLPLSRSERRGRYQLNGEK